MQLAGQRRVDLRALAGEPIIHFPRAESPELHNDLLRAYLAAGVDIEITLEAQDWITIVGLVAAGLGVSMVPTSSESVTWRGVVYRPLTPPAPRSIVAACHAESADSPVVQRFMAAIRAWRSSAPGPSGAHS